MRTVSCDLNVKIVGETIDGIDELKFRHLDNCQ